MRKGRLTKEEKKNRDDLLAKSSNQELLEALEAAGYMQSFYNYMKVMGIDTDLPIPEKLKGKIRIESFKETANSFKRELLRRL